jgi:flagellar protein FlbD
MIMLSRLGGQPFALNPDLIERAEATPDTVITLCDGSKVIVSEPVPELIDRVREFRASVVALAQHMSTTGTGRPLHVVPDPKD